jgi:hypothetical protein
MNIIKKSIKWENNDYIVKGIGGYGGDKIKDIIGKNTIEKYPDC